MSMTEAEAKALIGEPVVEAQPTGREPFALWWQRYQAQARALGFGDTEMDQMNNYAIEIPGVSDMIHLIPRAKISAAELAAHKTAQRRGLPEPLSAAQLDTLKWKRDIFLRIMRSPTPPEVREAGWYVNQVENVGDMMTAAYWGGKGILYTLGKLGLKTKGPAAKYVGWAMVAKDIADIINLFRVARTVRATKKGQALKSGSMNPFSKESKLSRGFKLKAKLPGVPDWIEIFQVTDQFFGVGISFGGIVGFANDLAFGLRKGARIIVPKAASPEQNSLCLKGFEGGCALQLEGP